MKFKLINRNLLTGALGLLFFLLTAVCSYAQSPSNIDVAVEYLSKSKLYFECQLFKKTLESQAKEIGSKPLSPSQKEAFRQAYEQIWTKYDQFLSSLKKDLIGIQGNLNETEQGNLFAEVKADYEQNFLIVYQQFSQGKALPEEMLKLGVDLVKNIIRGLKEKKLDKKELFNQVLTIVNTRFYNQLRLKTYAELNIPLNLADNSPVVQTQNATTDIVVPEPTLNEMSGSIKFIKKDINLGDIPMLFQKGSGKDIIIEEEKSQDSSINFTVFSSAETHAVGTKFVIEAEVNCFLYVIVLNSNGVSFLYPRIKYASMGKDIEISSEETPQLGKVLLPAKGQFSIVADKAESTKNTEDFALIFSASELIIEDVVEQLNTTEGSLAARIKSNLGGDKLLDFEQIGNSDGQSFSFNAKAGILPLVFKINR